MNKLLIVLLAMCLVSAHAFVKRETPAETTPSALEALEKQSQDFLKTAQNVLGENFEKVKKGTEQLIDDIHKMFEAQKNEGSSNGV